MISMRGMLRAPALLLPRIVSIGAFSRASRAECSSSWAVRRFATSSAALFSSSEAAPPAASVPRIKVKTIFESAAAGESLVGRTVKVQGWVRTLRDQKQLCFVEVNDGSRLQGVQVVADAALPCFAEVQRLTTGAAVEVVGRLVLSPAKGQALEIHADAVSLVGDCPAETYPLQKKRHSQEFLRTIAHLRPRTNTISAVARVRSALAFATHQFFQEQGFVYLQSPLITASDCEGAGEMFRVTTLPIDRPDDLPRVKTNDKDTDNKNSSNSNNNNNSNSNSSNNQTDFKADFFEKAAYLTVSGQLSGETYACALGDIYTFGPTFRAEKSQTTRHLAEFHMIEPEMAFADLHAAMDNAEQFVKFVVRHALTACRNDLEFFQKFMDKELLAKLDKLVNERFVRVSYREAIALLQAEIAKNPSQWQYPEVHFGTDLHTEHERWLAEKHFKGCVFVHNYPRQIKAFYMRDSPDNETVDSFDLLVPGVGELIGGSQREERLEQLRRKMKDFKLSEKDYEWYLDLRRFGSVPHSGYGLGFERLVCYVTGIENIREAIAFPRYPGHAEF